MAQIKPLKDPETSIEDRLMTIADIANAWGVSEKTVSNWAEFVYQAFEIILPASGPYPEWGVKLLSIAAKHVSAKASAYTSETGERRRLKGSEFIAKIRRLRSEGHFAEFQQFQNFRNAATLPTAEDLEDELVAEVGALTRETDERFAKLKSAIVQREEQQVNDLVGFVESSDHRVLGKLTSRLAANKMLKGVTDEQPSIDAIEVAYQKLPD